MSGVVSSASNSGVKCLSLDSSHSETETKRFHGDHPAPDVVMLNGSDVSQSVRVFLDVNDWDSASHDSLCALCSDGTVVTCTTGGNARGSCRMSRGSSIFLRPPEVAAGVCRQVCAPFDPVLFQRAKMEEKKLVDKMKVHDVVPRADAVKNECRVVRTSWVLAEWGLR